MAMMERLIAKSPVAFVGRLWLSVLYEFRRIVLAQGGNQDVWVKSGRSLKHLKAT